MCVTQTSAIPERAEEVVVLDAQLCQGKKRKRKLRRQ